MRRIPFFRVKTGFCVLLTLSIVFFYDDLINGRLFQPLQKEQTTVTVLFWTEFYKENPLLKLPPGHLSNNDTVKLITCPLVPHCQFTTNKSELNKSDGVIFHASDLTNDKSPSDLPQARDLSIPWIILHEESPIHTYIWLSLYNNIFNWTMTYRSDSDIHWPYGKTIPIPTSSRPENESFTKQFPNRTGKVAWTVSHCKAHSQRQRIVAELSKFIDVHIYGYCGRHECSYGHQADDGCHKQLQSTYKFYLAFENSLCQEYISEKLFSALKHSLLPIVYGLGPYETIAPPNSYIDVKNFSSIQSLGAYLKFLDENPEEYDKYFEWKKSHRVEVPYFQPWCQLCHKLLKQREDGAVRQWYSDLSTWYISKSPNVTSAVIRSDNSSSRNNGTSRSSKKLTKACVNPWDFIKLP